MTPNQGGATNWFSPSFSPQTGLFYVNANRAFSVWYIYDPSDNPMGWGGTDRGGYAEQGAAQGHRLQDRQDPLERASLRRQLRSAEHGRQRPLRVRRATASLPSTRRPAMALWDSRIGGVTNGPITYELDGRQYVIAGAGARLAAFVLNP